jgi:carbon starvation protein
MLTESLVGVMAMVAAATLDPGVYFAMNVGPAVLGTTAQSAAEAIAQWGFTLSPDQMTTLAKEMGESTLLSRTGGAPSLAVGMAGILHNVFSGAGMALWYHFAIMFEALFILTTLDAGTRVGRFMLQDLGRHVWPAFGRTSWMPAVVLSSAMIVAMWGHFLWQGVIDPLGGINSLWPLFGISNQLLAAIALCVGTTVLISNGRARHAWITLLPLAWLATVTFSAGLVKVFSDAPRLGFLAHAHLLESAIASGTLPAGVATVDVARRLIFNDWLNAIVALVFMAVTVMVLLLSMYRWRRLLQRARATSGS